MLSHMKKKLCVIVSHSQHGEFVIVGKKASAAASE